jgi:hypothetical protein
MIKKQDSKSKLFSLLRTVSQRVKSFFVHAGGGTLTALWFSVISLFLLLLFLFTSSLRAKITGEKINVYLSENGSGRILTAPVSAWGMSGEAISLGSWWILGRENEVDKTETYGVIFTVLQNGVFAPFLGIALDNGDAELIPLTKSAKTMGARLTPGMLDIYKRRVSIAAKKVIERRSALAAKKI